MAIIPRLEKILAESTLTFEEQRAFSLGLGYMTDEEQDEFSRMLEDNSDLIYPLYINFKSKLRALTAPQEEWDSIVENEVKEFERLLGDR